jgi:hypothetical protein
MAFVPVPDTVMVEAIYEWDGQIVENTMYFERLAGATAEADITGLLNIVLDTITTELLPLLASAIKIVRLVGTLLDAVDAIAVTLTVSPPIVGGDAAESMPNNVTYCVSFITAQRGRSFRGRNYVPGLTIASVNGNTISSTFRTGLLAFYSELKAAAIADEWEMVVVSRFSNGEERGTGVTTPINAFTTFDATVDSQRRRLPGRGT